MAHSIIYVSDGTAGGLTKGKLAPIVQGQSGQVLTLEVRDLGNNLVDLTGYDTITGRKRANSSGDVTSIVGALALSGTPTASPQATFTIDEDDSGESGYFTTIITFSNGVNILKCFPATWHIQNDPAVNATTAAGTVGVTELQSLLLAALEATTGLAEFNGTGGRTAIVIQAFMRTFLAAATAVAARIGLLPSYTGNTGNVLAVNGDETDVEWVAQSGGGIADAVDANNYLRTSGAWVQAGDAATKNSSVISGGAGTVAERGPGMTGDIQAQAPGGGTTAFYARTGGGASALKVADGSDVLMTSIDWQGILRFHGADAATNRASQRTEIGAGDTVEYIIVALSDEETALTAGTAKQTFVMPYAMTLTSVVANVNVAPTGSALQVDINEGVSSILSTKLTIDATEKTSATAATPAVISDSALASGAKIIFDIDAVGSVVAGAGLKVTLIGTRA